MAIPCRCPPPKKNVDASWCGVGLDQGQVESVGPCRDFYLNLVDETWMEKFLELVLGIAESERVSDDSRILLRYLEPPEALKQNGDGSKQPGVWKIPVNVNF